MWSCQSSRVTKTIEKERKLIISRELKLLFLFSLWHWADSQSEWSDFGQTEIKTHFVFIPSVLFVILVFPVLTGKKCSVEAGYFPTHCTGRSFRDIFPGCRCCLCWWRKEMIPGGCDVTPRLRRTLHPQQGRPKENNWHIFSKISVNCGWESRLHNKTLPRRLYKYSFH